jgi:exonuclease III
VQGTAPTAGDEWALNKCTKPRHAREGERRSLATRQVSMISRLLWTMAEAELAWRDQHFPVCKRRVSFLTAEWGAANLESRPYWTDACAATPNSHKVRGWSSGDGAFKEAMITEVLALVNLNPQSTRDVPIWGAVWFNRKERWVRVSWAKRTPTPDRWLQSLLHTVSHLPVGGTAADQDTAGATRAVQSVFAHGRSKVTWAVRYASPREGDAWGSRSLWFSGWWLWHWWRYPRGGGRMAPTDEKTARGWWERSMAQPTMPPSPQNIKNCLTGPLRCSPMPEPPLVAVQPELEEPESKKVWTTAAEWGGQILPPPSQRSALTCRMVCWNADGWHADLDEEWWAFLLAGAIDVCCLQDTRWTQGVSNSLKKSARAWGEQQLKWTAALPHRDAPAGVGGTCISSRTTWGARRMDSGVDDREWSRYAWDKTAGRGRRALLTITLYAPSVESAKWQEQQLSGLTELALHGECEEREVVDAWWLLLTDILHFLQDHLNPRTSVLIVGDFNFDPQRDGSPRTARGAIWSRFLQEAGLVVVSVDQNGRGLTTYEHGTASSCIDLVLASRTVAAGFQVGVLGGLKYSSLHKPVVISIPLELVLGLRADDLTEAVPRVRKGRLRRSDARAVARYQEALMGSPATEKDKAKPPIWSPKVDGLITTAQLLGQQLREQPVDPDTGYPATDPQLQTAMDAGMKAVLGALCKAQEAACRAPKDGSNRRKNGWSPITAQMAECMRRVHRIITLLRSGRRGQVLATAVARAAEQLPTEMEQGGGLHPDTGLLAIHPLSQCLRHPPATNARNSIMLAWAADLLRFCQALRQKNQGRERKARRLRMSEAVAAKEKGRRAVTAGGLRRYINGAMDRPERDGGYRSLTLQRADGSPRIVSSPTEVKRELTQTFATWLGWRRRRHWHTSTPPPLPPHLARRTGCGQTLPLAVSYGGRFRLARSPQRRRRG